MNLDKIKLPTTAGCYQFLDKAGKILYIGKAANLKNRVSSYWRSGTIQTPAKTAMIAKVNQIKIIDTDSEIEALLLEANLVKKHQPPYNILLRDDKRFSYIKITNDIYPRIITTREIDKEGRYFGPFTSGTAVRETIKAIGKIFPFGKFATMPSSKTNDVKIKRYPELYRAPENLLEYKKIIKQIVNFLEGNSKKVIKQLEGQIKKSKISNPDQASKIKYQILNMKNVLAHTNILSIHDKYASDVVELAKILSLKNIPKRIEGYDISNIFGKDAVGSMVVFNGGEPDKSQYRKFKIKDATSHNKKSPLERGFRGVSSIGDTQMLKEILTRRFTDKHTKGKDAWPLPDLIIIDGGKGQLNAGLAILKKFKLDISIISISKGEGLRSAHAPDKIFFPGEKNPLKLPLSSPALHIIKRVRDESHRFAITFHKQRRKKNMFRK